MFNVRRNCDRESSGISKIYEKDAYITETIQTKSAFKQIALSICAHVERTHVGAHTNKQTHAHRVFMYVLTIQFNSIMSSLFRNLKAFAQYCLNMSMKNFF